MQSSLGPSIYPMPGPSRNPMPGPSGNPMPSHSMIDRMQAPLQDVTNVLQQSGCQTSLDKGQEWGQCSFGSAPSNPHRPFMDTRPSSQDYRGYTGHVHGMSIYQDCQIYPTTCSDSMASTATCATVSPSSGPYFPSFPCPPSFPSRCSPQDICPGVQGQFLSPSGDLGMSLHTSPPPSGFLPGYGHSKATFTSGSDDMGQHSDRFSMTLASYLKCTYPRPSSSQAFSSAGSSRAQGQFSSPRQLLCKTQGQNFHEGGNGSTGPQLPTQTVDVSVFHGHSNGFPEAATLSGSRGYSPAGCSSDGTTLHFGSGIQSQNDPGTSGFPSEQMAATQIGRSLDSPLHLGATSNTSVVPPPMNPDITSGQQCVSIGDGTQQGIQAVNQGHNQSIGRSQQTNLLSSQTMSPDTREASQLIDKLVFQMSMGTYSNPSVISDTLRDINIDDFNLPSGACSPAEFLNPMGLNDQSCGTSSSTLASSAPQQSVNCSSDQLKSPHPSWATPELGAPASLSGPPKPRGQAVMEATNSNSGSQSPTRPCAFTQQTEPANQSVGIQPQSTLADEPVSGLGFSSCAEDSMSASNLQQEPNSPPGGTQTTGSGRFSPGSSTSQVNEKPRKRKNTEEDPQEEQPKKIPPNFYTPVYFDFVESPNLSSRESLLRCRQHFAYVLMRSRENADATDDRRRREATASHPWLSEGREATASHPRLSEALSRPPLNSTKNLMMAAVDGQTTPSMSQAAEASVTSPSAI